MIHDGHEVIEEDELAWMRRDCRADMLSPEEFRARFGPLFRVLERERLARVRTFQQMSTEKNAIRLSSP